MAAFCANPVLMPDAIEERESVDWTKALADALVVMMAHVGLDDRRIDLQAWTLDPTSDDLFDQSGTVPEDQPFEPVRGGALVEYAGTEGDTTTFVFDHRCTASPDRLLGAASLAVAEAYRESVTGDELDDQDVETEFWASCIGFGIFLTNGSHVVETWAETQASITRSTTLGALGPPEHVRLLAAKIKAMRLEEEEIANIRSELRPNARDPLTAQLAADDLLAELDLPDRTNWPREKAAVPPRTDIQSRVTVSRPVAMHRSAIERASARVNEGRPVFRVRSTPMLPQLYVWGILTVVATLFVAIAAPHPSFGILGAIFPLGVLWWQWKHPSYKCSHPTCLSMLEADAETCPECGGNLVGTINNADDRLAAEEDWFEKHPDQAPDKTASIEPRADDSPLFLASQTRDYSAVDPETEVLVAFVPDEEVLAQFELPNGELGLFVFSAQSRAEEWTPEIDIEIRTLEWASIVEIAGGNVLAIGVNPSSDFVMIRAFEVAGIG